MSIFSPVSILFDSEGNPVTVFSGSGGFYLGSAIVQNTSISESNSSTDNLGPFQSFTGVGESSLGFVSIQVTVICDKELSLKVQQSFDNVNWDVEDSFIVSAAACESKTIQVSLSYFRVIVENREGTTTSYLRLRSLLFPISEVFPRALTDDGNFKVAIEEQLPLQDAEGNCVGVNVDGNNSLMSSDDEIRVSLVKILVELKKINSHLEQLTDSTFEDEDVE